MAWCIGNTDFSRTSRHSCKTSEKNQKEYKEEQLMGFCQYAIIILYSISLGTHIAKHGEPKTGTYNVWSAIIALAIEMSLLYFGGFFK